jgi:hypothetical protein
MDISAPASAGTRPTMAIFPAPGMAALLDECRAQGRMPVFVQELGGEKERASFGPRELLERTQAALAGMEPLEKWGAGAKVRTPEDAAQFATAGYTWFILDLAQSIENRADTMSLEELDSAIVSWEDRGVLRPNWHEDYVEQEFEMEGAAPIRFSDEVLARTAVKFAPLLALAGEIDRAIRTCWSGRGEPPDIEVSLAPAGPVTKPEELLFLSRELVFHVDHLAAVAPALGHQFEPGSEEPEDANLLTASLGGLDSSTTTPLVLPSAVTAWLPKAERHHLDATDRGRLALLSHAANHAPDLFREWLAAACEAFPIARSGWPISLTEEEARFLPQVEDPELSSFFTGTVAGRQLLLSTWETIFTGERGPKLRALAGGAC